MNLLGTGMVRMATSWRGLICREMCSLSSTFFKFFSLPSLPPFGCWDRVPPHVVLAALLAPRSHGLQ